MVAELHKDTETDFSNRVSLGSIINKCLEEGQEERFAAVLLYIWGVKHRQFRYIFYFHLLLLSRTSIIPKARWISWVFFLIVLCFSEIRLPFPTSTKSKGKPHTKKKRWQKKLNL
jgi:hypothetical protein